jgi:hypothetical protein
VASAQSLGTLTLDLQAKTATLESDLGKAQRITEQRMQAIQKSAQATGEAIGAALAAGIGAAVAAVEHSLQVFDQFSKAAQKVGIPTEQFSQLAYAAKLSDVSVEDLTSTLAKLAKNQVAAASGNKEMADNFKTLGVNVKNSDGSLRSTNDVFGDLADLFQNLPDGAGKTAIAIALLGKSGANAIPLLNGGRDSLKELSDQAEAFGITVDKATGESAEHFNDNLVKLGSAAEGFGAQLAKDLLPALNQYSDALVDGAQKEGGFKSAADTVADALKYVVIGVGTAVAVVKDLTTILTGAGDAIARFYNIASKGGSKAANPFSFFTDVIPAAKKFFSGDNSDASQVVSNVSGGLSDANNGLSQLMSSFLNPDKAQVAAAKADDTDALKRQQAFIDAAGKRETATKAQAEADRLARQAQKEALDLDDRVSKDANSMAANLQKQADVLYKSTVPGLDEYNQSLQRINEEGAKFLKDSTNKITGVIRPEDEDRIDKYVAQMQQLAKATLDAASAVNALAERNKTLDLEAQATDAVAAQQGFAGLAVEANNYATQVAELEKAYENNSASDATEQYQRQRDALDTLHQLRVQSIKSDYDDTSKFIKAGAQTLQDAIADALSGDGFKNGIKGFLDGIGDALRKAAAQIVAADLGRLVFGNAGQTGQLGGASSGWLSSLGSLFGGSGGQSNNADAAAVRQQEASVTGQSSGTGYLDAFLSLFKASGGPVYAGKGYIVGEEGPEWFQPPSNGTIMPNRALPGMASGSGRGITQVNNFQTMGVIDRQTQSQLAQKSGTAAQRAINRNR